MDWRMGEGAFGTVGAGNWYEEPSYDAVNGFSITPTEALVLKQKHSTD